MRERKVGKCKKKKTDKTFIFSLFDNTKLLIVPKQLVKNVQLLKLY